MSSLAEGRGGLYIVAGLHRHTAPVIAAVRSALAVSELPFAELSSDPVSLEFRMGLIGLGTCFGWGVIVDGLRYPLCSIALQLAMRHTVIASMQVDSCKSVYRRLCEGTGVHPMDIETIRGVYAITGVPSESGMGAVEDLRLFSESSEVLESVDEETISKSEGIFVERALEKVNQGIMLLSDVISRFGEATVEGRVRLDVSEASISPA
jgi:hypothetical protein